MDLGLLHNINWIDILILTLLLRTVFIGIKRGVVSELFKSLSLLFAIYFSLHYFSRIAEFLSQKSPLPIGLAELISFVSVILFILVCLRFIREGILLLFKTEVVAGINRWLGALLGVFRGLMAASLLLWGFILTDLAYLNGSINSSYSGIKIISIAPYIYQGLFNNIVVKFFPDEYINAEVSEILKEKEDEIR